MALVDGGPESLVQHQLRDSFQVFTPRPCTPRPPIAKHVVLTLDSRPSRSPAYPIDVQQVRVHLVESNDDKLLEIN